MKKVKLPFVIGHRGACGYVPENTLASMQKAHEIGLSWVEFDVMLTRDNALVIFHDETLERTTNGIGSVRESALSYLKRLDAGSWFSRHFRGEKIPTLQEMLQCCNALQLGINIELKSVGDEADLLAKKSLEEIQKCWPSQNSTPLLSSFSLKTLEALSALSCPYPLGWILEKWREDWEKISEKLHLFSLHFPVSELNASRVSAIHAGGHKVLAFTVNTKEEARQLRAMGVDAVFSDVELS